MKKLLMAAVASTALFATPAFAQFGQDAQGWYNVSATGQTFCRFGTSNTGGAAVNGTVDTNAYSGAAEADGNFVFDIQNDNDDTVQQAQGKYEIGNAVCNTPFTVAARSDNGGLKSANTTSDTAFAQLIGYEVDFDFDGLNGTPVNITTSDALILTGNEARAGAATLRVRTASMPGALVLQGGYNDKLIVTMTPSVGS